jgi:hypothetical protein
MPSMTSTVYSHIPDGGITISRLMLCPFSRHDTNERKRTRIVQALINLKASSRVISRPIPSTKDKGADRAIYYRFDDPLLPKTTTTKPTRYVSEFKPLGAEYDLRAHQRMNEGMRVGR